MVNSKETVNANTYYTIRIQINYETAKDELYKAVETLFERKVIYFDAANEKVVTRWVSTITYNKQEHSISICWALGILPCTSELKAHFTKGDKYKLFGDLNKYVIEAPIKYVNKHTDISVSMLDQYGKKSYFKEGKKVVGIRFSVCW